VEAVSAVPEAVARETTSHWAAGAADVRLLPATATEPDQRLRPCHDLPSVWTAGA